MVGWLALRRERGRLRVEEELIGSMRVIRAVVYEPEGLAPWRLRFRLRFGFGLGNRLRLRLLFAAPVGYGIYLGTDKYECDLDDRIHRLWQVAVYGITAYRVHQ